MEQAQQIADVLVAAAEQVAAALRGLRTAADLAAQLVEIHRLENEADRLVRAAVASLFATGIDPMMVIRWKDIFETLEEARSTRARPWPTCSRGSPQARPGLISPGYQRIRAQGATASHCA